MSNIISLDEPAKMADRAITEAVGFCDLGDLLSLDLKDDEAGGSGGSPRFIGFSGRVRLFRLAITAVRGRVVVIKDEDIRRWVPVRVDLEADHDRRLSVDFAYWFEPDYKLVLGLTAGYCAPDAWPNVSDMGRRPEPTRIG